MWIERNISLFHKSKIVHFDVVIEQTILTPREAGNYFTDGNQTRLTIKLHLFHTTTKVFIDLLRTEIAFEMFACNRI